MKVYFIFLLYLFGCCSPCIYCEKGNDQLFYFNAIESPIDCVTMVPFKRLPLKTNKFDFIYYEGECISFSKQGIESFVEVLSDTNCYSDGECIDIYNDGYFMLYDRGKPIAKIYYTCGLSQLDFEPDNANTRYGHLSPIGSQLLIDIVKSEKALHPS